MAFESEGPDHWPWKNGEAPWLLGSCIASLALGTVHSSLRDTNRVLARNSVGAASVGLWLMENSEWWGWELASGRKLENACSKQAGMISNSRRQTQNHRKTGRATGLVGRWVRRELTNNSGEHCPHWLLFTRWGRRNGLKVPGDLWFQDNME